MSESKPPPDGSPGPSPDPAAPEPAASPAAPSPGGAEAGATTGAEAEPAAATEARAAAAAETKAAVAAAPTPAAAEPTPAEPTPAAAAPTPAAPTPAAAAPTPAAPKPAEAAPTPAAPKPAPARPTPAVPKPAAAAPPGSGTAAEPEQPEPPRAPRWITTLRAEPPLVIGKLLSLACMLVVLVVWFMFTRGDGVERPISRAKLPSPTEVFYRYTTDDLSSRAGPDGNQPKPTYKYTFDELQDRDLFDSIIATMRRVLKGFGLAALVGVLLGVFAASFRAANAFFQPLVLFGRSLPLAALIPITVLWFGIYEKQKEMFIFIAALPFIFSDTVKAISLVPQRYVETAQTLGASKRQIITKVLFPLALPDIVTSLRFLFGLALGYIMLAEVINAKAGLGYMINTGERLSLTEQNYLLLFIIGIVAYLVDWTLRFFQKYFFHYRKDL